MPREFYSAVGWLRRRNARAIVRDAALRLRLAKTTLFRAAWASFAIDQPQARHDFWSERRTAITLPKL
jgi:hypothetical protein